MSSGRWDARSAIVEANAKLLNKLEQYPDPGVCAFWLKRRFAWLNTSNVERRFEAANDQSRSDRFE
jgi:hypothetical protein